MVMDIESTVIQTQAITQSGVLGALHAQEKAILDALVGAHRGKKLTDRDAAIGIATISEIRGVLSKLDRALMAGFDQMQQLTEGESNGNR